MNSRWLKITVRFVGAILLVFAIGRFFIDIFSSFHAESTASPGGGGTIDSVFHVSFLTLILGIVGSAFSFRTPRNKA